MKDIPGVFIILGAFLIGSVILLVYSQNSPSPIQTPENAWSHLEELRSKISDRSLKIAPGDSMQKESSVFSISVRRLSNVSIEDQLRGRYIARVLPKEVLYVEDDFLKDGIEVGWIDPTPEGYVGALRTVGFRKIALLH